MVHIDSNSEKLDISLFKHLQAIFSQASKEPLRLLRSGIIAAERKAAARSNTCVYYNKVDSEKPLFFGLPYQIRRFTPEISGLLLIIFLSSIRISRDRVLCSLSIYSWLCSEKAYGGYTQSLIMCFYGFSIIVKGVQMKVRSS